MITLETRYSERGIECEHEVLGKVATIERKFENGGGWFVFPYRFAPYERGATFKSLRAAEFYALALAYEMYEMRESNRG
jgi:hypothetical protein